MQKHNTEGDTNRSYLLRELTRYPESRITNIMQLQIHDTDLATFLEVSLVLLCGKNGWNKIWTITIHGQCS